MPDIRMYTSATCGYCMAAKNLLKARGASWTEIRIDLDPGERQRMVETAHRYYASFDNVFGGPGIVDRGIIRPLPRTQTAEELGQNILICQKDELIDRLSAYAEMGIDEVITTSIFGQPQEETLDMMSMFAAEVMPHLLPLTRKAA